MLAVVATQDVVSITAGDRIVVISTADVVVPVATRVMLPAIGQLIVGMLLNSAYVSQIGARDITGVARNIINSMFTTEIWLVVALTYFLIAFPVSRFLSWLERRLALTW